MKEYTRFVGMDVHKDTVYIALAEGGRGDPEFLCQIANDEMAVRRWLARQRRKWDTLDDVLMCYEAGPCGYGLYRLLKSCRVDCVVVAPGMTPRKPNEKIKTDRRDALKLARFLRAGELTAVWVPDEEHESFRQVLRYRSKVVVERTRARHQLSKYLLAQGLRAEAGVNNWTKRHTRWLDSLRFVRHNDEFVFIEMRHHILECSDRLDRMDELVSQAVEQSPLQKAIRTVECLKGFREVGAATVCAELGEVCRFATPTELMSYTGLVPGVASSGNHTKLFGITKVGNVHLRRILVEAAWSYRTRPNVGRELARRQRGHPADIIRASWRAQNRLNGKYRRLIARGKHANKAIVAVARELVGFVWEVLQLLPPIASQPAS